MPMWHNVRLSNELLLTHHCPALVKWGVICLGDLVDGEAIPLLFWKQLAPAWQQVYLCWVGELQAGYRSMSSYCGPHPGRWAYAWTSRKMVLFMQH